MEALMKLLKCFSVMILAGICFMTGPAPVSAEDGALVSLLDKISERIISYQGMKNFKVEQIEKKIEMNKKWEPEKTTIIKKIVKNTDDYMEWEILEETETENGKTTDLLEKYAGQIEKPGGKMIFLEKKTDSLPIAFLNRLFPFGESKRSEFDIRRLDNAVMDGKDVFVLESVAKTKDENRYEGTCYIDQNTFDVLKIDVKPSKYPKSVKEMRREFEFEVLPEGYFVIKKEKEKKEEKHVFRTVRQITETESMNHEILDPDTR